MGHNRILPLIAAVPAIHRLTEITAENPDRCEANRFSEAGYFFNVGASASGTSGNGSAYYLRFMRNIPLVFRLTGAAVLASNVNIVLEDNIIMCYGGKFVRFNKHGLTTLTTMQSNAVRRFMCYKCTA